MGQVANRKNLTELQQLKSKLESVNTALKQNYEKQSRELFKQKLANYYNLPKQNYWGSNVNINILETNVINIALLVGLLIYSFTDVVKSTLKEREDSISLNLDTAANKLIFANQQFKDAEETLASIRLKAKQLITSEIQKFKNELVSEIGSYKQLLAERKRYLDNETYFSYLKLAKTN